MSKKVLHRRKYIFKLVLLFHACILLFILYINGWFAFRTPHVQEEKPTIQERVIKNKKDIQEKKDKYPVKEQRLAANKIYLPTQEIIEEQREKKVELVKEEPERAIEEEIYFASKEPSTENDKRAEDIAAIEKAKPIAEEQNVNSHKKMPDATPKQVSLPEIENIAVEPSKTSKPFDFKEYKAELIENYKARDGENIPLLLIDDHGKNGLYKAGLGFYGYQLIARPTVTLKEPYYFVINNSVMKRIAKTCPYTGEFPSSIQEDRKLFSELLSHTNFAESSNMEYELFYAPLDSEMLTVIKSKLRSIIDDIGLVSNDISKMKVTFKEIGSSYILIIESIVTAKGERIDVNDPDNKITIVG